MEPGAEPEQLVFHLSRWSVEFLQRTITLKKTLVYNGTLGGETEQHSFPFPAINRDRRPQNVWCGTSTAAHAAAKRSPPT